MVVFWGFLIAASLTSPKRLNAQAAPGPIVPAQSQEQSPAQPPQPAAKPKQPQVPARTTLAGPWKLNRDESDDPRQRVRSAESSSSGNTSGYPGGGNTGGYPGGYPGGGRRGGNPYPGGGGGGPYGGQRNTGQDIEDNPKMQPLIYSSQSLNIELKNPEVDVTDDQFHKLVLYTDGRQLQKSTDNNHQEVAAHWNGSQLVSDEKSPLGGKMSRTFELSQDGRNLQETLHIDNGRSKTPLVIRYVYDVASSDMQTGPESDPNRPVLKRRPDDSSNSPQ
jgi:hypothetical protein